MHAVTIREAKARLNALVEAAERGEQVVLMRGSRHVASIVPINEDDLELAPRLSDSQAQRLWREMGSGSAQGAGFVADSPADAVAFLAERAPDGRRRPRSTARRRRR